MNPFRGVDFYQADDLLSDVERMARDTVREWVGERVVPVIDTHFEDGTFPMHLIPEMAELGLFGANLPEEYGCAGMNNVAYGLVMQELERATAEYAASRPFRARWSCIRSTLLALRNRSATGFRCLPEARRSAVSDSQSRITDRIPEA